MSDNGSTITRGEHTFKVAAPKVRTKVRAFTFYPGDEEILKMIEEFLGTENSSDALRTALRSFGAHISFLAGTRVES